MLIFMLGSIADLTLAVKMVKMRVLNDRQTVFCKLVIFVSKKHQIMIPFTSVNREYEAKE